MAPMARQGVEDSQLGVLLVSCGAGIFHWKRRNGRWNAKYRAKRSDAEHGPTS